jgi:hypothetical protein
MIPIVTRIEMFNNHPRISKIRPRTTIVLPPDGRYVQAPPALMSNVDPQAPRGGRSVKVGEALEIRAGDLFHAIWTSAQV